MAGSRVRRGQLWLARVLAWAFTFALPLSASATTYYVAPTGSDTAAGTEAAPFASWARAQTAASPGDTVYFRGGTYHYTMEGHLCVHLGVTPCAGSDGLRRAAWT